MFKLSWEMESNKLETAIQLKIGKIAFPGSRNVIEFEKIEREGSSGINPVNHCVPGAIILFLRARYCLLNGGHIDESVQLYWRSIRSQSEYKQFHHICHWELAVTNIFLLHWTRAAWHANKLYEESRWSKSIYAYLLAVCIEADKSGDIATISNKCAKAEQLLWLFLRAICLGKLGEFHEAFGIFQKIIRR
ncbi:unnamed protein product [Meloidogyne enterolobii]|uniref:Uncharacterized protein n=1 Tax=Meloidogyne enterolobii TaxID=390850 RepID=A0ACB0ZCM6_MELEN